MDTGVLQPGIFPVHFVTSWPLTPTDRSSLPGFNIAPYSVQLCGHINEENNIA